MDGDGVGKLMSINSLVDVLEGGGGMGLWRGYRGVRELY